MATDNLRSTNSRDQQNVRANQIGLAAAVSIGVGGMVGAGIFSILGVVGQRNVAVVCHWRIAMMGSAAFLLVYAVVNAGHPRVLKQAGANPLIVWLSIVTCLAVFATLALYTYQQQPLAILALLIVAVGSFVAEAIYRRVTGRKIKLD